MKENKIVVEVSKNEVEKMMEGFAMAIETNVESIIISEKKEMIILFQALKYIVDGLEVLEKNDSKELFN